VESTRIRVTVRDTAADTTSWTVVDQPLFDRARRLILTLTVWNSRRRTVVTSAPVAERRVVEEPARTEYDVERRV